MARVGIKLVLPLLVVGASVAVAALVIGNKPEASRQSPPPQPISVEATRAFPSRYTVVVKTQGTVRPRTESTLIPQVGGRVIEVSPSFRDGGFFERGDVLLRIEPRDYELAIATAEAQVAQAQSALEQELALAKVVEDDWRKLGKQAPELGLRKPQIAAAEADLASGRAALERARLDLERTVIRAPYAGRVLEQSVDVAQFVSVGTVLAQIYAIDYVEIRLPLSSRQLEFVVLPERFRDDADDVLPQGPAVRVEARIGRTAHHWDGRIVRAEGAIDTQSRQLFVVAQVDDPYARGPQGRPPLRVGQFVEAQIQGRTLEDVFVIPRSALREGGEVLIVDAQSRLQRRSVTVVWSRAEEVVIAAGLEPSDVVVLTPISVASSGALAIATINGIPLESSPRISGAEREPGRGMRTR